MNVLKKMLTVLFISCLLFTFYKVALARINGEVPTIFGHQLYYVLSGSMEPKLHTGSIILVSKKTPSLKLSKNEIITFKMPYNETILVTHRIHKIIHANGKNFYETKGDANPVKDPWVVTQDQIVSVYSGFTIPYVGYVFKLVNGNGRSYLLLVIVGVLLILMGLKFYKKSYVKV
ncbi:signal peptidase I [Bacillus sp. RG28]|uniref:Signal peptidase I n=1 Tax=Gottfriedia endophytica TaxID=2820819 RepID=A0A940NIS8_9BACI|nr:signal peptidase I [Gottfriedia endophytica]MBP0725110.1 signal peptidase I [Gottfriedia endophytica]